jgi:DNA-directed RNA polymerase specialized sigma24 family protein
VPVDHFPSTHATWIDAQLTIAERSRAAGDAAGEVNAIDALRRHLMERYHAALRAYVCGGSLRRLGEPDELVGGFFVDRACKPGFLMQWRASGLPLRRWMMTGINLYGKSIIRQRSRDRLRTSVEWGGGEDDGSIAGTEEFTAESDELNAEQAFERAWSRTILKTALARVHAELDARGRLDDFAAFRRHAVEGEPYDSIAADLGRTVQQVSVANRAVLDRLRTEVREVLRDEGITEAEIEAAIGDVYRAFGIERRRP